MATEYAPAIWVDGALLRDPMPEDICLSYEEAWELAQQLAANCAGARPESDVRVAVIHRDVGRWSGPRRPGERAPEEIREANRRRTAAMEARS